jgi:hypothetical protein
MSLADRKFITWLKALSGDLTEAGLFSRLVLYQSTSNGTDLISSFELSEELLSSPEGLEVLGQTIWDLANEEVDTAYGMNQRFVVAAFRGDSEQYERRHPFKITKHRSVEQQLGGESVTPNEVGVTAQMIRHDSENHRLIMLLSGTHAERMDSQNQRLHAELQAMQERQSRFLQTQEDLFDRKAERELHNAVELRKAQQHEKIAGMVLTFLPLMFSKATGTGNVNGNAISAHARDLAVGNFLRNLTMDEFRKVVEGLKPENQIQCIELFKSYKTDDKVAQAEKPEVLREQPPPDPGAN